MDGRIAVVTGASRGLGRAMAIALGAAGAHVVAVARTVGGLEEVDDAVRAAGGSASLVPLDLADAAGIDRLGAVIFQRWGRVDALLSAAGQLGAITPLGHLEARVWDESIAVNLTANWRLLRSLDPLLRLSDAGRAVFVTSAAARNCRPYWGAYAVAKAGLEALVRTYAGEVATTPTRANLFDPGPLRTAMRAKAMPGEDPMSVPHPETAVPKLMEMLSPAFAANGVLVDLRAGTTRNFA